MPAELFEGGTSLDRAIAEMSREAVGPRYFQLAPTATYKRRRFGWFAGTGNHTDNRLGTLRLILDPASGGEAHVDEYGVRQGPFSGAFRLCHDETGNVYGCVLGKDWSRCNCKAGRRTLRASTWQHSRS